MTRKVYDINREVLAKLQASDGSLVSTANPVPTDVREIYTNDEVLSAQNPLPADGDSVYVKDVKVSLTDDGTFTGQDISSVFNNLDNSITDSSATNPKWFKVFLERPIRLYEMGLVAKTGNFSNVKISLLDRQGSVLEAIDDSANATDYTSHAYRATLAKNCCCILVEFHTTDTVTLSFAYIRKVITVEALIMGMDEGTGLPTVAKFDNGEFIVGGQVKLKTAENDVVGASDPLPTYSVLEDEFGNTGRMLSDNMFLGAPVTVQSEHHEIHCGDSFITSRIVDLGNGASDTLLIIVPNEAGTGQSQVLYHLLPLVSSESEIIAYLYEAPTITNNGTQITSYNRNRNSVLTAGLSIYHTPTVTSDGTLIQVVHTGSGRGVGGESRSEEFVLANNTKYLLRITNQTAINNYITWHLNHYKHPGV